MIDSQLIEVNDDEVHRVEPPSGGIDPQRGACSALLRHNSTEPIMIGGEARREFEVFAGEAIPISDIAPRERLYYQASAGIKIRILWQRLGGN